MENFSSTGFSSGKVVGKVASALPEHQGIIRVQFRAELASQHLLAWLIGGRLELSWPFLPSEFQSTFSRRLPFEKRTSPPSGKRSPGRFDVLYVTFGSYLDF